jgi:hypothetical protein
MKDEILPKVATEGAFDLSQNVLLLEQNVQVEETEYLVSTLAVLTLLVENGIRGCSNCLKN